ncbi:unnamed protein product [Cylicocyclus nassatus]|uniref:C2H2-type domain-containing protein n=1 Tax=Cylicocyclus nassatus TaxID=53992 RepID=A0AA36GHG7_CYLNA|nr:unnamed protein product [Cylicocyclus nassatus]
MRRKQARPTKRPQEDYDFDGLEPAKVTKTEPTPAQDEKPPLNSTDDRLHTIEMIPSCSKDPTPGELPKKTTANPLLLLERSLKRFEPQKPGGQPVRSSASTFSNGLGALFQFVGKMQAQQRKENDVDSILKCLQCGKNFQTMEMLIRHMQDTQHFNNLPKTYSSLIQMERQKVLNLKLQMKSESMKLACVKCGEIPANIDKHLKEVHDVKTSSDWLRNIRIIREGENSMSSLSSAPQTAANSPHLNKLMSLINTVDKK